MNKLSVLTLLSRSVHKMWTHRLLEMIENTCWYTLGSQVRDDLVLSLEMVGLRNRVVCHYRKYLSRCYYSEREGALTSCDMRSMSWNNTVRTSAKYEATCGRKLWSVTLEVIFPSRDTLMQVSSILLPRQHPAGAPSPSSPVSPHTPQNTACAVSAAIRLGHDPVCKHLHTSVSRSKRCVQGRLSVPLVSRSMVLSSVQTGHVTKTEASRQPAEPSQTETGCMPQVPSQ